MIPDSAPEPSPFQKKVAVFVPSLKSGGAERVMASLANEFSALGYSVDLVLCLKEGPYLEEVSPDVRIVDLGAPRVSRAALPLIRYLKKEQPFVLLSALSHANVVAILARILSRVRMRVVVSERGVPTRGSEGRPSGFLARLPRKLFYPRADKIISVSQGVGGELVSEFGIDPSLVTTIYNPLYLSMIASLAAEKNQHPWFHEEGVEVILAVGRLQPVKDHGTLLQALSILRATRNVRLIVLGEGPLENRLISLAEELGVSDAVDFPGFQSNPYSWMSSCDVFAHASVSEGLSSVLMQAMACGAKIVSSTSYGPVELLEGGRWGRLVPVGNSQALAFAISEALDDTQPPDVKQRARDFESSHIVQQYVAALGI